MKKLTLPRLASAVLGALFFLAACIVLAVRLVRGEAGLTDAAALALTAAGGAALTVLALRSRAPGLRRSLWVLLASAAVFLVFYGLAQQTPHGVTLAGVGITPDIPVEVDDDTYLKIYSNALEKSEDAQLQAAIAALTQGNP